MSITISERGEGEKSLTSAQDNYYIAISRARQEAKIYTNDKEKLPEAMNRKNEKETALSLTYREKEPEIHKRVEKQVLELNRKIPEKREIELSR